MIWALLWFGIGFWILGCYVIWFTFENELQNLIYVVLKGFGFYNHNNLSVICCNSKWEIKDCETYLKSKKTKIEFTYQYGMNIKNIPLEYRGLKKQGVYFKWNESVCPDKAKKYHYCNTHTLNQQDRNLLLAIRRGSIYFSGILIKKMTFECNWLIWTGYLIKNQYNQYVVTQKGIDALYNDNRYLRPLPEFKSNMRVCNYNSQNYQSMLKRQLKIIKEFFAWAGAKLVIKCNDPDIDLSDI